MLLCDALAALKQDLEIEEFVSGDGPRVVQKCLQCRTVPAAGSTASGDTKKENFHTKVCPAFKKPKARPEKETP